MGLDARIPDFYIGMDGASAPKRIISNATQNGCAIRYSVSKNSSSARASLKPLVAP